MSEPSFQGRVGAWMQVCFGPVISADKLERGDRLLEEVFELLQSGNYPIERIRSLAAYVWSRPAGDPAQEVGGVKVTLAAYCLAHDIDMHLAGETELDRVWTKVDAIRAKQAAKPTGSALPIPITSDNSDDPTRKLFDKLAITVEEMAALLGMGRNSAYEAVRRGDVQSVRIGGSIRVPTAPLRRALGLDGDGRS